MRDSEKERASMPTNLLFTLLCDDVREETSGKLTIIGLYNYAIGFVAPNLIPDASKPIKFVLPQLCIVQRWHIDSPGRKAVTEIVGPQGQPVARAEVTLVVSPEEGYSHAIMKFMGMVLDPGKYTLRTVFESLVHEESFEVKIAQHHHGSAGKSVA